MNPESLQKLSDQELQRRIKEIKNGKIINAFIIGFTIGIYIYSCVKNGFGVVTFFPLIITYLVVKNSKTNEVLEKEIRKELKSRNLE